MKKHLFLIIFALCAAAFVFAACSNNAAPDEAEPAAAPVATATPEPSPEPMPELTPEPAPKPELHCDSDIAVNAFMSDESNYSGKTEQEKLEALYNFLDVEGIVPEDIEQWDCENEYAQGYIAWYNTNYPSANTATPQPPLTQEEIEEWRQRSEESAKRADEEEARDFAEAQQWMEENFDLSGY